MTYDRLYYYASPNYIPVFRMALSLLGCDVNQYGEECSNCSNRCLECDVVKGCVSCRRQFIGSDCQLCQPGFMGENCGKVYFFRMGSIF